MRRQFLLIVYYLFLFSIANGQSSLAKSYTPPSPNSAQLGLVSTIPINYFNGSVEISIPIRKISIKSSSTDISLQYNSNGIRKNEEANFLGLGWVLNGIGVITRVKRDKDDLGTNGFWKRTSTECSDDIDQEPDLFIFNFCGYQGKFIITGNTGGLPIVKFYREMPFKISIAYSLNTISVITDNGTKYDFEQKEESQETADNKTEIYISSWYLTKITNTSSQQISFAYTVSKFLFKRTFTSSNNTDVTSCNPTNLFSSYYYFGSMNGTTYYGLIGHTSSSQTSTLLSDEVLPSTIITDNYNISFTYSNRIDVQTNGGLYAKKLDKIVFQQTFNSTYSTEYRFTYDYFNSGSGQPDNVSKRLKLNSIQQFTGTNSLPAYSLVYTSTDVDDKANSQAYAGFLPDPSKGLIKELHYPTGGYTKFSFENNINNLGVRIKSIENYEGTNSYNMRSFEYVGGKVANNTFINQNYTYFIPVQATYTVNNQTSYINGTIYFKSVTKMDQAPLGENSADYFIGYDEVIEKFGTSGTQGKKEYYYLNENPSANSALVPVPVNVSTTNGSLTKELEYAYDINASTSDHYILTSEKDYTNTKTRSQIITFNRKSNYGGSPTCTNTYQASSDRVQLTEETDHFYDANNVDRSKTYKYSYATTSMQLSTTEEKGSDNIWVKHTDKYPEDFVVSGNVYSKMINLNMLDKKIESADYKQDQNGTYQFLKKNTINYKEWAPKQYNSESNYLQILNNSSTLIDNIDNYDENDNVLQQTLKNGSVESYEWGYNNNFPILKITNAHNTAPVYSQFTQNSKTPLPVGNSGTSASFTSYFDGDVTVQIQPGTYLAGPGTVYCNLYVSLSGASSTAAYICISNNNSCSGTQSSVTFPNMPAGSYSLSISPTTNTANSPIDIFYTYQNRQLVTSSLKEFFYEGFEQNTSNSSTTPLIGQYYHADDYLVPFTIQNNRSYYIDYYYLQNGAWIYTKKNYQNNMTLNEGTAIDEVRVYPKDALISTYTYNPAFGITSESDANGKTLIYKYDDFGKLVLIRDNNNNIIKKFQYTYSSIIP